MSSAKWMAVWASRSTGCRLRRKQWKTAWALNITSHSTRMGLPWLWKTWREFQRVTSSLKPSFSMRQRPWPNSWTTAAPLRPEGMVVAQYQSVAYGVSRDSPAMRS